MTIKNLVFAANNETLVGEEWSLLYDREKYSAICWDGSKYVGFRDNRMIKSLDNGSTWTTEEVSISNSEVRDIAYGNGVYVAITVNGVYRSTDLYAWTQVITATGKEVKFKFGNFHCFLSDSTYRKSSDGINWTSVAASNLISTFDLSSSTNIVAAGVNGYIATSTDSGSTWTQRTSPIANQSWYKLARSNSIYVLIGSSSLATSTDGISWTIRDDKTTDILYSLIWNGSLFIATHSTGAISSPDGITWTNRTLPGTSRDAIFLYKAATSGTSTVFVGDYGRIVSTTDGITFTDRNKKSMSRITTTGTGNVIWDGSRFVYAMKDGVFYSSNGIDWISSLTSTVVYPNSYSIAYNGTRYVACVANTIRHTTNLVSGPWNEISFRSMFKIIWDGNKFIAVGFATPGQSNNISTSVDGITWTDRIGSDKILYDIAYNGSTYVAVGTGGTILSSNDGISWTQRTSNTISPLRYVLWSGSEFFISDEFSPLKSSDGVSWTTYTSDETTSQTSVHTGQLYLGRGIGKMIYSYDGISWADSTQTSLNPEKIIYANNRAYAINIKGSVLTSPPFDIGYI